MVRSTLLVNEVEPMKRNAVKAALALSLILPCALVLSAVAGTAKGEKAPAKLIKVPLTRQSTDYTCGVAALQSVLAFFGEDIREG
ncbi:MAG: hypothetical protein K2Z81_06015, partial [Cyanobacteria bacterium]|nr:hypothetical protein [Cyanobacteriota bacterium]